jgi:hypothetical protein
MKELSRVYDDTLSDLLLRPGAAGSISFKGRCVHIKRIMDDDYLEQSTRWMCEDITRESFLKPQRNQGNSSLRCWGSCKMMSSAGNRVGQLKITEIISSRSAQQYFGHILWMWFIVTYTHENEGSRVHKHIIWYIYMLYECS